MIAPPRWEVRRSNNYLYIDEDLVEGVREVARIGLLFDESRNGHHHADARLIAAAPELLAVLENLEKRLRGVAAGVGSDCQELDWANDALAAIRRAKEG